LSDLAWQRAGKQEKSATVVEEDHFKQIMDGKVWRYDKAVDINNLFLRMQHAMIDRLRRVPANQTDPVAFFQPIAALGRGSILAFYEREDDAADRHGDTLPSLRGAWRASDRASSGDLDLNWDESEAT
ncbi:MAG TPA: hypothetical protein VMU84_11915, partial [Thermoanaerobaculia bacterium]|nr:hypothetical protein [Thermoanaerobaculia bacterium]